MGAGFSLHLSSTLIHSKKTIKKPVTTGLKVHIHQTIIFIGIVVQLFHI